jgi:septum formation protein
MRLILASASPRRAELLTAAGYSFETCAVDIDERVRPGELPAEYVRRLAQDKSAAAIHLFHPLEDAIASDQGPNTAADEIHRPRFSDAGLPGGLGRADVLVLGADTSVVVGERIFGKPRDDEEAAAMIRQLAGRAHQVLTGISVRRASREAGGVERTAVWFTTLTAEDVAWYIASGEGRGKAGAYAIQGLASRFISRIEGSYSNVVGLPIATVHALIRQVTVDDSSGG